MKAGHEVHEAGHEDHEENQENMKEKRKLETFMHLQRFKIWIAR